MKVTARQLRQIIREAVAEVLDAEDPSDIEAEEGIWSGGENIHLGVDHAKEYGGETNIDVPEMLDIVGEHRSGQGAHMARQKASPMHSRAAEELARVIRQQRKG